MSKASKRRNARAFMVVLVTTFLVWFVASMSEEKEYTATIPVDYIGYDTARYALVSADTAVTLSIRSNGFRAVGRSFSLPDKHIAINIGSLFHGMPDSEEAIAFVLRTDRLQETFASQLHLPGHVSILPITEKLHLKIAQRCCKAFVPQLKNVDFTFTMGRGVYGAPVVSPDTVFLYGSMEHLSQIDQLTTAPATIANVVASSTYTLPLDTVWQRFPDLRVSTHEVQVHVPVEEYTENSYTLPLHLIAADTLLKVRVYPTDVKVSFWVAKKDYTSTRPNDFKAVVTYNSAALSTARVVVSEFPDFVRIKSVQPDTVQIVRIK